MDYIIDFPPAAAVNRNIPKNKIYDKAGSGRKVKDLFIREVDQITWSYKLSPETINIPMLAPVMEIQVFTVSLKTGSLDQEVLRTIDKVIPSPIIFRLLYNHRIQYVAAYKRPNESDTSRSVLSEYFTSPWIGTKSSLKSIPVSLNLQALYHQLLLNLIPLQPRPEENMDQLISRFELIRIKDLEIERLKIRMIREKQFNRKVELNSLIKEITAEMMKLQH